MTKKGLVFDIQRFSLNDGPGIRTTIFMKGCSLRCSWCHNPESIYNKKQLKYDSKKCCLCGKCVKWVKEKGIQIKNEMLEIDFNIHNETLDLVQVCENGAYGIYGQEYSISEIMNIVLKDKEYYEESNGGVTLSGGEALNQLEFIVELSKELKKQNIDVSLDISGFNSIDSLKKTFTSVDRYLVDYKIKDESLQKRYIGQVIDFENVIKELEKANKEVILRCPIIIDVNDEDNHFKNIGDLSRRYTNISRIDILPYHNMKKAFRFKRINTERAFKVPNASDKERWRKLLKSEKINECYLENKLI